MLAIFDKMQDACKERSLKTLEMCAKILPNFSANVSATILERNARHPFLACLYHAVMTGADIEQVQRWSRLIIQELGTRQWPNAGVICFQSPLLSEILETRGISVTPSRVDEGHWSKELNRFNDMTEVLRLDGFKQLTDPISSYSIVDLNGSAAPRLYSGSRSSCFRSAHGAAISSLEEYIEILSHEASHINIFILEAKLGALVLGNYSDAYYYSPWRGDPRPLYGIFHGAMVFSITVGFLSKIQSQQAQMRVSKLCVELEEAFRQLGDYGQLSDLGSDLLEMAANNILTIKSKIPQSLLVKEQEVLKERKARFLEKYGNSRIHVS